MYTTVCEHVVKSKGSLALDISVISKWQWSNVPSHNVGLANMSL